MITGIQQFKLNYKLIVLKYPALNFYYLKFYQLLRKMAATLSLSTNSTDFNELIFTQSSIFTLTI